MMCGVPSWLDQAERCNRAGDEFKSYHPGALPLLLDLADQVADLVGQAVCVPRSWSRPMRRTRSGLKRSRTVNARRL